MKQLIIVIFLIFSIAFSVNIYAADISAYKSATEYDYPPFSVTTDGKADGFSVELLEAVANVMDLTISFRIDSWATLKEDLKNGDLDVLPLVGYTEERDRYFDFTVPYIVMHGNIFIRKDNNTIETEEDLYDKEIIVMAGDNAHEYAKRMNFSDNLILTETYEEAFRLLASGKHDAVLAQSLVGQQLINTLKINNIKAATTFDQDGKTEIKTNLTGFEQKFCFAVKEGDNKLLSKLNEGLAIVSSNGRFNELYVKWFPFLLENKPTLIESIRSSLVVLIPLIILILLISTIYTRNQIRIAKKKLVESNKSLKIMESKLQTQHRIESISILANGIAHEISNPLNGILNYSQLISDIINNDFENIENFKETVKTFSSGIIYETDRISKIIKSLRHYSQNSEKPFSKTNIKDILRDALSISNTVLEADITTIEIDMQEDLSLLNHSKTIIKVTMQENLPLIKCQPKQIQQVIYNLLTNAQNSLNQKFPDNDEIKKIFLNVENIIFNGSSGIRITIEDHGIGISKDIQSHIFDPFFTTKNRSEGTGLSLSISYGIIKDHNGELTFESKEGEYTRFCIDLPAYIEQDQ